MVAAHVVSDGVRDLLFRRLQVETVGFLKDKPKALHAFRVVTKGHIYLLAAKSAALKQDWMKVHQNNKTIELFTFTSPIRPTFYFLRR